MSLWKEHPWVCDVRIYQCINIALFGDSAWVFDGERADHCGGRYSWDWRKQGNVWVLEGGKCFLNVRKYSHPVKAFIVWKPADEFEKKWDFSVLFHTPTPTHPPTHPHTKQSILGKGIVQTPWKPTLLEYYNSLCFINYLLTLWLQFYI